MPARGLSGSVLIMAPLITQDAGENYVIKVATNLVITLIMSIGGLEAQRL